MAPADNVVFTLGECRQYGLEIAKRLEDDMNQIFDGLNRMLANYIPEEGASEATVVEIPAVVYDKVYLTLARLEDYLIDARAHLK
jgi:DUF1680 family protein